MPSSSSSVSNTSLPIGLRGTQFFWIPYLLLYLWASPVASVLLSVVSRCWIIEPLFRLLDKKQRARLVRLT